MSEYCTCCEQDQRDKKRAKRKLIQFRLKALKGEQPLAICEYCDGEELVNSVTKNRD